MRQPWGHPYIPDGENRRVGKSVNGTLVEGLLYQDGLHAVAQLDGHGNLVARFVFGSKANVPDYFTNASGTFRILSDHLGSPRLVVNVSTGAVAEEIDYDEFGRVTNDTSPGLTPFGFAGGLYEPQTGLVRFGARDYDPSVGRWTAKDPIRFGGGQANMYVYANSDPINGLDPNGEKVCPLPPASDIAACLACNYVSTMRDRIISMSLTRLTRPCPIAASVWVAPSGLESCREHSGVVASLGQTQGRAIATSASSSPLRGPERSTEGG